MIQVRTWRNNSYTMARTMVTLRKRAKTSDEEAIQSGLSSIAEPGTPVSTVTVSDIGTPVTAKLSDVLVDTDSENDDYKVSIFGKRPDTAIPLKRKIDMFKEDPMEVESKPAFVTTSPVKLEFPNDETKFANVASAVNLGHDDDDDEIPVGDEYIAEESNEAPESGTRRCTPLETAKSPEPENR